MPDDCSAIDVLSSVTYTSYMPIEVRQTTEFARWFATLRDDRAADRIAIRIRRLAIGNPGVTRSVGGRVSEIKIDYGPGYRLYFTRRRMRLVILLCGGDKSSQKHDIEKAKAMAGEI